MQKYIYLFYSILLHHHNNSVVIYWSLLTMYNEMNIFFVALIFILRSRLFRSISTCTVHSTVYILCSLYLPILSKFTFGKSLNIYLPCIWLPFLIQIHVIVSISTVWLCSLSATIHPHRCSMPVSLSLSLCFCLRICYFIFPFSRVVLFAICSLWTHISCKYEIWCCYANRLRDLYSSNQAWNICVCFCTHLCHISLWIFVF